MAEDDKHLPDTSGAVRPAVKPAHILTADLFIADIIVPPHEQRVPADDVLDKLLAGNHAKRGEKISLSKMEYDDLAAAVSQIPNTTLEPGGSTGDILTTLKRLMGEKADVQFIGAMGHGDRDKIMRDNFARSGVTLATPEIPGAISSTSFIFKEANGPRTLATYPGNAAEVVKPDMISDSLVRQSDAVFIQGSLWRKFGPEVPETLLKKAEAQDKEVWLSLPRQAKFKHPMPEGTLPRLMQAADIIMADEEELLDIYQTSDIHAAIQKLQDEVKQHDVARIQSGRQPNGKPVKVFVKHPDNSATYFTCSGGVPSELKTLPAPANIKGQFPVIGAGDAYFAGLLAGHIRGLSMDNTAKFALDIAVEKYRYGSVRIPMTPEAEQRLKEISKQLEYIGLGLGVSAQNAARKDPRPKGFWPKVRFMFSAERLPSTLSPLLDIYIYASRMKNRLGGGKAFSSIDQTLETAGILGSIAGASWFLNSSRVVNVPEGETAKDRFFYILKHPQQYTAQLYFFCNNALFSLFAAGRFIRTYNSFKKDLMGTDLPKISLKGAFSGSKDPVLFIDKLTPLISALIIVPSIIMSVYGSLHIRTPEQEAKDKAKKQAKQQGHGLKVETGDPKTAHSKAISVEALHEEKFSSSTSQVQSAGKNKENPMWNAITMFSPGRLKESWAFAFHKNPVGISASLMSQAVALGFFGTGLAKWIQATKHTGQYNDPKKYPLGSPELKTAISTQRNETILGAMEFVMNLVFLTYYYDGQVRDYKAKHAQSKNDGESREDNHGHVAR